MRLQLPSQSGGSSGHFMSFPNKTQPLPPVPHPSSSSSSSQKVKEPLSSSTSASLSKEWSPLSSIPSNAMGPPRPPPTRIADAQFELNQNLVRPTSVDGAMDWIDRHKPQIDQFLTLLEQYPQLVQSERLDATRKALPPIKRSASESAAFPAKTRPNQNQLQRRWRRRKHHSEDSSAQTHGASVSTTPRGDHRIKHGDLVASERYIYVCDVISESEESLPQPSNPLPATTLPSAREKIVTALSSYCFVRTGPELLHSEAEFVELTHTIANADAFILLMNDRVMSSGTCFHQLAVAAAYDIPILSVKESGFKLAEPLAAELQDIEIIPRYLGAKSTHSLDETGGNENEHGAKNEKTNLQESQSSGFHSESEGEDVRHPTLAELITDCYNDALLYVSNFHNSCISKLLGKLSEYLGDAYLDFEVSQQSGGEETALINDRMTIPKIGNISTSVGIPSINKGVLKLHRNQKDREEASLSMPDNKRESANLPETPMSVDRSTGTPSSIAKLPPIGKTSPDGLSTTKLYERVDEMTRTSQTRDTARTGSDRTSVNESVDPRESQYTGQSTSGLDSDQSDWDLLSCTDSSPFLETNYIVFPSNETGFEKRPPFTVNFPRDIAAIDRRRSSGSTDYGFNYVKLDFKYDVIAPSPIGFDFSDDEEEPEKPQPPKKEPKPRVKKPPKPIQVKVRNTRPVREQQLVKMATISIKYGMPV